MAADQPKHQTRNPTARLGELLDASALGLVTVLLLGASFFMTWRGVSDFIASREFGDSAVSLGLVFIIVATLSLAMYVALREMIAPYFVRGWWSAIWKRVVAGILYSVLAFWSVGFGYGFWWSLLAGQSATEAGLERTVASVRQETGDIRARLAAAGSVMSSANALSDRKAALEATRGGTCGINSPAGEGPLARARSETQAQIAALTLTVQEEWREPLNDRMGQLEADLQLAFDEAATLEGAARKKRFEALGQASVTAAAAIGTDATARGRTIAAQLRAKADQLSIAPVNANVAYCYDPDLAAALTTAADELDQTYKINVVPFRFAEGPDGVAQAIEDLFVRAGELVGIDTGRTSQPLGGRDLIALLAALGIDLALFVFGLLRGSGRRYELRAAREHDASGEVVIGQAEPELLEISPTKTLPPPQNASETTAGKAKSQPRIRRVEAKPSAVGIGSSASGQRSQINETEQIDDLIESVDGIFRAHSDKDLMAMKDEEIRRLRRELEQLKPLKTELDRLQRQGYLETGRPGQMFDAAMHKQVGLRWSSKDAKGTIIATVRPGYLLSGGGLFRVAEVIVSAGPNPEEADD